MNTIGMLISLLSAVIAATALYRTRISTEKQRRLQVAAHVQSYLKGLHEWGDDVIESLTEAIFLCELDPERMEKDEFFKKRNLLRMLLSSQIDKGRMFLPNSDETLIGIWKDPAYRGLRQLTLHYVEVGYSLVESLDYKKQAPNLPKREDIVKAKRQFVSELQDILDVRRTTELIRKLANEINGSA